MTPLIVLSDPLIYPFIQSAVRNTVKVPPPVPSKPKQANFPSGGQMGHGKTTGTFPGKSKSSAPQLPIGIQSGGTLPLPSKLEDPPAATVYPFSPEPPGAKDSGGQLLHKPQILTTSSIYSMYTQPQGALSRAPNRGSNFISGERCLCLPGHLNHLADR